jgi:hypothetical protein
MTRKICFVFSAFWVCFIYRENHTNWSRETTLERFVAMLIWNNVYDSVLFTKGSKTKSKDTIRDINLHSSVFIFHSSISKLARSASGEAISLSSWAGWVRIPHGSLMSSAISIYWALSLVRCCNGSIAIWYVAATTEYRGAWSLVILWVRLSLRSLKRSRGPTGKTPARHAGKRWFNSIRDHFAVWSVGVFGGTPPR